MVELDRERRRPCRRRGCRGPCPRGADGGSHPFPARARLGVDFDFHVHSSCCGRARDQARRVEKRSAPVATRSRTVTYSMNSELTEFSFADPQHRLGEQPRHREHADLLARLRVGAQRDGVGHHQLVERRLLDPLHRRAREHRVRAVRHHARRALLLQRLRRLAQRVRGVDHVVHDHAGAALDVADDVHHLRHVRPRPALVDDREVATRAASRAPAPAPRRRRPATPRPGSRNRASTRRRAGSASRRRCPPGCRRTPGSGRRADPSSAPGRRRPR